MALQYITDVASKASPWSSKPVLTEEDEAFLQKVTSNADGADSSGEAILLGKDAQVALMDGAQDIPLPMSPTEDIEKELPGKKLEIEENKLEAESSSAPATKKKARPWSIWLRKGSTDKKDSVKGKEPNRHDADEIATKPTASDGENISDKEKREEQEDLATILERLNLAADNNRAFSISAETQELLQKFKLIFKDLVTGVPTAYHDLEMLLTNGDKQLKDAFGHLPGFMQKLVRQLPNKFTENLAPELMAVAGERAAQSGINMENAGKAAAAAQKMGFKAPTLKELVGKPTAIVGMLRSIMTFLRARFPAVLGMNVLWSIALFIVLLVLWYCHKRGKEVRLENERLVTEAEIAKMNEDYEQNIRPTETLSTTAPKNASISEVRSGIEQVQKAREEALASSSANLDNTESNSTLETIENVPEAPASSSAVAPLPVSTNNAAPATPTARRNSSRFSLLRTFSKRSKPGESTVRPYPDT